MAQQRVSMRKTKEILRLHFDRRLGKRQIARSCNVSHSTVLDYLRRAQEAGLSWPLPEGIDDSALESLLFVPRSEPAGRWPLRQQPDFQQMHHELSRSGVTLQLLWEEYKERYPEGYEYSQYCLLYRQWAKTLDIALRQQYRAGEKLFVDFAGTTVPLVDPATGERSDAHIFVAALGASNYTYAEAVLKEDLPSWIGCHVRAFEYIGGVPEIVIPDNLKAAVSKACRYEPDLNPTYRDLAEHYDTVVIPARPREPRDKAKVESAVMVVTRWILAALRKRTFFSLAELNKAIRELLERLNSRPFRKVDGSRRDLFERLDKPALRPLPRERYQYAQWKRATVTIDYHIEVDGHYYSVPYQLVRKPVEVRLTAHTVEAFFKSKRVAMHQRSSRKGAFTTASGHRPSAHQRHLEWTPSRIIQWAGQTGAHTAKLIEGILLSKPHPEQGYRSALGLLRLAKRYSPERLEAACQRALSLKAYSYRSVKSILQNGLDTVPLPEEPQEGMLPLAHDNIRGSAYYQ